MIAGGVSWQSQSIVPAELLALSQDTPGSRILLDSERDIGPRVCRNSLRHVFSGYMRPCFKWIHTRSPLKGRKRGHSAFPVWAWKDWHALAALSPLPKSWPWNGKKSVPKIAPLRPAVGHWSSEHYARV